MGLLSTDTQQKLYDTQKRFSSPVPSFLPLKVHQASHAKRHSSPGLNQLGLDGCHRLLVDSWGDGHKAYMGLGSTRCRNSIWKSCFYNCCQRNVQQIDMGLEVAGVTSLLLTPSFKFEIA